MKAGTDRIWGLSYLRNWANHLSFRVKLGLLVNLIIVVLILGSAFLIERRQRTAIVQEVEKRALLMAQSLASTVTNDLLTYNYVSIEQTTLQFSKKPDLVYVIVLDKEGSVAAQFIRDFPLSRMLQQLGRVETADGSGGSTPSAWYGTRNSL